MDTYTNEQLIAFCQEALRIPSYSGQEKGVAELMKRKMEEYGFDEVIIDRFGSVLGTINGKRPGKTILTGVLADKDYNCMYRNVEPYAKEFITVTPGNPRALNAHDLAQYLSQFGKPVTACDAVADGVRLAVEHAGKDGVVLCYGSLYMIGEIEAGLQQL